MPKPAPGDDGQRQAETMRLRPLPEGKDAQLSSAMSDISFLLIIFFLVATVLVAVEGLYLILPDKDEQPLELEPEKVVQVAILSEGNYTVDGTPVARDLLASRLTAAYARAAGLVTIIEAARGIVYQEVLSVMETARLSGGATFSVMTSKSEPLPVGLEEDGP